MLKVGSFTAFLVFFVVISLFASIFSPVQAQQHNNKFGIHISDIDEAEKATQLVNSSGGDWGYVTITINSNDRVVGKWQDKFNVLAQKHLIPIIRIATYGEGDSWRIPSKDDPHDWAEFFNKLYWPTQKRIVTVFNEPNHATEWGNTVDPASVARFLNETIDALRASNPDYIILNPGFDSSAPQKLPAYMDQVTFMDAMEKEVPGIFSKLDGWSSHSYPNPGFAGMPTDTGRRTIANYKWEIDLLKKRFRVEKDLPVYITETGWVVNNVDHPNIRLSESGAAANMKEAYEKVWNPDASVVAVTPFLLTYRLPLFSHFSWIRPDNSETEMYSTIKSLQKNAGIPIRESKSIITTVSIPGQIAQNNEVLATITFKNIGNTQWTADEGFGIAANDPTKLVIRDNFELPASARITPGQSYTFRFTLFTENILAKAPLDFQLQQNELKFGEKLYIPIRIFQPPKLTIKTDPQTNVVTPVTITFQSLKDIDGIDNAQIAKSGVIGTYSSKVFVPNQGVLVTLAAPNRDQVTQKITMAEGENTLMITLPPEKGFIDRIRQAFKF
ncbi:MAG: cellulase family glycosylhydrolase [bacterium]|nr:cellulase family glycosylhydrolase [bacterium]